MSKTKKKRKTTKNCPLKIIRFFNIYYPFQENVTYAWRWKQTFGLTCRSALFGFNMYGHFAPRFNSGYLLFALHQRAKKANFSWKTQIIERIYPETSQKSICQTTETESYNTPLLLEKTVLLVEFHLFTEFIKLSIERRLSNG